MRACLIACLLFFPPVAGVTAQTSIPDLSHSVVEWAYAGDETLVLMVLPDGSGDPLTHAYLPSTPELGPQTVDATITLILLDPLDRPIAMYPFEDLWLEAADDGMAYCPGGTCADAQTDAEGRTNWTLPPEAGGHSSANLQVYINGDAAPGEGVPLHVRSPDLDGSLHVDLADIGAFAADYAAGYAERSDFNNDAALNLVDVRTLATGLGDDCP